MESYHGMPTFARSKLNMPILQTMKRVGNVASNKIYNPQNKKPPVPIDVDEADSSMERFIRAKYVQAAVNGTKKHNTGSSDEGTPPPLPPKTGSRFFSFRSKKDSRGRDTTHGSHDHPHSPEQNRNKASKVFGASVHQHPQDSPEAMAQKLTQLRDMGFTDDKRNAMILKGVNGSLEKTIEALVRLGEGGGSSLPVPSRESSLPATSRSLTPQPVSPRPTIGLSKSSPSQAPRPASQASNNPWDIQPARPQSTQSTGTLQNKNPFYASNPFDMPNQQAEFNLNQSLQNLSLAPFQQPLFPHHTGGLPSSQPMTQSFYQAPMTPPIAQTQNYSSFPFNNNNQTYPPPMAQPSQSYNPFLQAPAPAAPQASLSLNTSPFSSQGSFGNNPFTKSPTRLTSPTLNQIPEQSQQNFYSKPQSSYGSNPFFAMNQNQNQSLQPSPSAPQLQPTQQAWYELQQPAQATPQPEYQQAQQAYQQPQQAYQQPQQAYQQPQQAYQQTQQGHQQPQQGYQQSQPGYQQPQRADTASIMALFNYPHLAPAQSQIQDQNAVSVGTSQTVPVSTQAQAPPPQPASSPFAGNNNPFLSNGASPNPAPATALGLSPFAPTGNPNGTPSGARSRESMTLGMEMAWNNGRHSPDAFASLSARSS